MEVRHGSYVNVPGFQPRCRIVDFSLLNLRINCGQFCGGKAVISTAKPQRMLGLSKPLKTREFTFFIQNDFSTGHLPSQMILQLNLYIE